jgi:hypothetical protein
MMAQETFRMNAFPARTAAKGTAASAAAAAATHPNLLFPSVQEATVKNNSFASVYVIARH